MSEPGPVILNFVEVIIFPDVPAHGEQDFTSIKIHIRIPRRTLGAGIHDSPDFSSFAEIDGFQRAASLIAGRVYFPRLEQGLGIVVVRLVLMTNHKQDGLATDQRIGKKRLALQPSEGDLIRHRIQSAQKSLSLRITVREGRADILNGLPQCEAIPWENILRNTFFPRK